MAGGGVLLPWCTVRGRRGRSVAATVMAAVMAAAAGVAALAVGAVALPGRPLAGDFAGDAAQRAAAAGGPGVIAFPSPPAVPTKGRFHELPSLQCLLHPASEGGVSPDPVTVASSVGQGGNGWVLGANPKAEDVVIPYGAGTCASPLNDAFELSFLAAPDKLSEAWEIVAGSNTLPTDGDAESEFFRAGHAFHAVLSRDAMACHKVVDHQLSAVHFRPLPSPAAHAPSALVYEEEITRLLSLQRNQKGGFVAHQRGVYNVLGVGRASVGIVVDKQGKVVAAQDRVSGGFELGSHLSALMYQNRDGQHRPVLAGESALLTLGRGVMADPSWLGSAFPRRLNATVRMKMKRDGAVTGNATWSLRHGTVTNDSSRWLQEVANVLCTAPFSSFVMDDSLCDGVDRRNPANQAPLLADGLRVVSSLSFSGGTTADVLERALYWDIDPPGKAVTTPTCPSFDHLTFENADVKQPLWLLGRGDRELHTTAPAGRVERELAGRLSSCAYNDTQWHTRGDRQMYDDGTLLSRLSESYRRDIFQVDPPEVPVTNSGLILALVVVVPEAAAIVLLLLQRRSRPQRRSLSHWRQGSSLVLLVAGAPQRWRWVPGPAGAGGPRLARRGGAHQPAHSRQRDAAEPNG